MLQLNKEKIVGFFIFIIVILFIGTTGCTAIQPSQKWQEDQQDAYVNSSFNKSAEQFQSAGKMMNFHYFTIFDLITDPDLGNPQYLGREKGVKVTIAYNDSLDALQNTLWGHEVDATRVAQALFTGEQGEEIGFAAICFMYEGTGTNRIMLKLDAADAKAIRNSWNDDRYIKLSDWSESYLFDNNNIDRYEDPDSFIRIYKQNNYLQNPGDTYLPYGKEVLRSQLLEETASLTSLLDEISKASRESHYMEMKSLSNDLIDETQEIKKVIGDIPLIPELENIRQDYLKGVEKFWIAGTSYWYGATFLDDNKIENANDNIDAGLQDLNIALEGVNLDSINSRLVSYPSTKVLDEAFSLNERYLYSDSRKINDISIKVTNYYFKDGYIIEETDASQVVTSGYGYKFICVIVDVYHAGHRGGGSEIIQTPDLNDFILIYQGKEIDDSTPSGIIRNTGQMYQKVRLSREENLEGILIFLVPNDFDPKQAYIQIDLGREGVPVWKLI